MNGRELINTTIPGALQSWMAMQSWQAWDYFYCRPYPQHAFGPQQWPKDKGPVPTALPYGQILVSEGAEFVFRNGSPKFSVPDDPDADALVQKILTSNNMTERWVSLAEGAANQGAIAVKFSVDLSKTECPVRLTFLDVPQQCRIWVAPHDSHRILMVRIQYPYRETSGQWYFFREEWTEDFHVSYLPKYAGEASIAHEMDLPDYQQSLGDGDDWQILKEDVNPFGLIPVTIIRNRVKKGNPLGEGDCWRLFRLIDRIALTMHGEDKANQLHSEPIPVAINASIDNEGPLLPGEPLSIRNEEGEVAADMKLLEPSGAAREFSHRTIDRWEELLYKAAGLSRVNPAEVTNKGNMTELAFKMTYGRTIATSDQKRELWGNSGFSVLLQNILIGLLRLGGVKEVRKFSEQSQISCEWPPYFELTPQDVETVTNRTANQVEKGFLPIERGTERVARAEKIPQHEIKQMLLDLKPTHDAIKKRLAATPDETAVDGDADGDGV